MPIDLPITKAPAKADPYFIDAGGWQKPITVGDPTRVDLLGDRFGVAVAMPAMKEAEALVWIRRLNKGRKEGVTFEFPVNYDLPLLNRPTCAINTANVAQATILQLKNLSNTTIEEGRFISVHHDGHNYLHQADAETTIAATGGLPVLPRTRKPYSANDLVELDRPKIDGILEGDENSWTVSAAMNYGIEFDIVEMK